MPRCCIGLGGNVGNVAGTFRAALRKLAADGAVVHAVSQLYCTAPVGPHAGDAFHNACAVIETALSPRELLQSLQELESAAGRTREVRWGARTLDIDLLTYDDLTSNDAELTIPHPGIVYRRFVLDPLTEIVPGLMHPVTHRSIAELRQRLLKRPLPLRLDFNNEAIDLQIRRPLAEKWGTTIELESNIESPLADPTVLTMPSRSALNSAIIGTAGHADVIRVELDARLAAADPLAAATSVLTAMLDEPRVVGDCADA